MKRFIDTLQVKPFPIYPILFGLYPVVYLWSANRTQQPAYVLFPVLLTTLAGVLALYLLATLALRNVQRAALATTILVFFLLSYGQFAHLLEPVKSRQFQQYLLPGSAGLVLVILVVLLVRRTGSPRLTRILNGVAMALLLFPLVSAVPYYMGVAAEKRVHAEAEEPQAVSPIAGEKPRDIYFILVDNYGRQDALLEKFGYDNSEMIAALKERGFVVPDCAQANYYHTAPDMASILNMSYLDALGYSHSAYETRTGYTKMAPLIRNNQVIRKFHEYGYHVITFRGFMDMLDIKNGDTYVSIEEDTAYNLRLETDNFRALYYGTTLFQAANDQYKIYPDLLAEKGPGFLKPLLPDEDKPVIEERFQKFFDQNLYAFAELQRIPAEMKQPKFVYAHLYSAHWPFMHHPDGSMRLPFSEKMTTEGYVEGIQFTNNNLLPVIDAILANSDPKPVIILQGDHNNLWEGKVEWSGKDRIKIFSAYYLPDGGDALLSKDITPVNNFRLVFKHYFGEQIDLLPNVSYYLDRQTKKTKPAPLTCISTEPEEVDPAGK